VAGVIVQEAEGDLVQRGLGGADLGEDVDAVAVVVVEPASDRTSYAPPNRRPAIPPSEPPYNVTAAPTSVGAAGRPTTRAVTSAQTAQAPGPASQPQSSKKSCDSVSANAIDSTATPIAWTSAARHNTERSTGALSPTHTP